MIGSRSDAPAGAFAVQAAPIIAAAFAAPDPVAVADVQCFLRAVTPDRVLNEAWEVSRKASVKLSCIDPLRDLLDDLGASVRFVTAFTVWMVCGQRSQHTRSLKEIMYQCVDGDHGAAQLLPVRPPPIRSQQDAGQGEVQDLVCDAVDVAQRPNQSLPRRSKTLTLGTRTFIQPTIDPVHEPGIGHVANEQEQAIGRLVQSSVS